MEGWFKFERSWLENGVITADGDHLRVWLHLHALAAFEPRQAIFRGQAVTLQPGQLITGRKKLALVCGVQEDKVQRILKRFEQADLIAQETARANRKITLKLHNREASEPHDTAAETDAFLHNRCTTDTQPLRSPCTTGAQPMHTLKEQKKEKNQRAKKPRAGARKPPFDQSVFGPDASYDRSLFFKNAIGFRPCDRKADPEPHNESEKNRPAENSAEESAAFPHSTG